MVEGQRFGGVVLLALVVTTAGCLGIITGNKKLGFAASDATPSEDALTQTGYSEYRDESINQTRNFTVAGQTRTAEISNEVHGYNRSVSLGAGTATANVSVNAARVVIYATPAVKIAGQTLNPIGRLSTRQIVTQLGGSSNFGQIEFQRNRSVKILGSTRTVSVFRSTQSIGGVQTNVTLHVATFRHGSDFLVAIAIHPEAAKGESQRVDTLLQSLSHPKNG